MSSISTIGGMVARPAAQDVHREAIAALRLFQEAARRQEVTAELVRDLSVYFREARMDPSLRFREPSACS